MASLGITVVGTLFSMVISVLCAHGLSCRGPPGHRTILMLLIVTLFVSAGLIPSYLVVVGLGGYNQYWALIVPTAVSVFNIIVLRAFSSGTATELIDAARMDGAGEWRILWSVVLPTSRAVTAVVTPFYAAWYWNSFFNVMLCMPLDSRKWPPQYVLYQYVSLGFNMPGQTNSGFGDGKSLTAPPLQMAVVVLTLLPVVVAFPFLQKHLAKGMLTGAIKELGGAGQGLRKRLREAALRLRAQNQPPRATQWHHSPVRSLDHHPDASRKPGARPVALRP